MAITPERSHRLGAVESAFATLPDRYLGADPGFDATYHIKLTDLGHTWEVRCTAHGARVRKGKLEKVPYLLVVGVHMCGLAGRFRVGERTTSRSLGG